MGPEPKIGGANAIVIGAGTLGHEARHEIDINNLFHGKLPQNKAQEYTTETNAYNTQAAIYRGLGVASQLDTPEGLSSAAQKSTKFWCENGGNCQ
jgi:hypothetical protein